jgi:PAS domain S-box-containing protein
MVNTSSKTYRTVPYLALCFMAVLGNVGMVQLFLGFYFLFGNFFVFIILSLFGPLSAVLPAVVAAVYAAYVFGHPFAVIWLTGEIVWVGLWMKYGRIKSLVLYDLAYWTVVGGPMIYLVFSVHLGLSPTAASTLALKHWVNGQANALLAALILGIPGIRRVTTKLTGRRISVPLRRHIFSLVMASLILPGMILMTVYGRAQDEEITKEITQELRLASEAAKSRYRTWVHNLELRAAVFADILGASVTEPQEFENLSEGQFVSKLLQDLFPEALEAAFFVGPEENPILRYRQNDAPALCPAETDLAGTSTLVHGEIAFSSGFRCIRYVTHFGNNQDLKFEITLSSNVLDTVVLESIELSPHVTRMALRNRAGHVLHSPFGDLSPLDAHLPFTDHRRIHDNHNIGDVFHILPEQSGFVPQWGQWQNSRFRINVPFDLGTDWIVTTEVPFRPYQDALYRSRRIALVAVILLTFFAVGFASVFTHRISKPILDLVGVTEDLSAGHGTTATTEWPETEVSEYEILTARFRAMAETLEQRMEELETRVTERTAELQNLNLTLSEEVRHRINAENASAQRAEWYQQLYRNSPIVMCTLDRDGHMVDANDRFTEQFGLRPEVIENRSATKILRPIFTDQKALEILPRIWENGQANDVPAECRTPSGETIDVLLSGAVSIHPTGRDICILTFQNITAIRQAEEKLRNAKEVAEAASRMKDEFLANISHEIRTPLNGILGMLQLLETEPLSETQREYLTLAEHSANGLTELLSDILDLSRLESSQLKTHNTTIEIRSLIRSVMEVFRIKAEAKGIDMVFDPSNSLPDIIRSDPRKLRQVLFNILGNAVKFTDEGRVEIRVTPDPDRKNALYIEIRDTGVGIQPDMLPLLLKPFTRAHNRVDPLTGGVGIGLTVAHRLLHLLGGYLRISSAPGSGTIVGLSVPDIHTEPSHHNEPTPGQHPPADTSADAGTHTGADAFVEAGTHTPHSSETGISSDADHSDTHRTKRSFASGDQADPPMDRKTRSMGNKKILVVEDEAINRIALRDLLSRAGYTILEASDGVEALAVLSQRDVDCVLMDVRMPSMGGLETTTRIRSGKNGVRNPEVPIIAVTAHAMEGDREGLLAAGMNDYVSKPIDHDELEHKLAILL